MSNMAKDVMKGTLAAYGILMAVGTVIGGVYGAIMGRKIKKALKEFDA